MPGIGVDTEWYSREGVGPAEIAKARRDLSVAPGTPLFVAVGELSRRKRMADAINALALMRHRNAILAIAGSGTEQGRLEALARERGVWDRVRLAGKVSDVRPLVSSATALILASGREGLARAIMEALSLEVPVVASTARGNRELVGSDAGFIFPIGRVDQLAYRMDWLIEHPADAEEMGRRGRTRMVEQYDLRPLVRMHEDLYRGMLIERDRRTSRSEVHHPDSRTT